MSSFSSTLRSIIMLFMPFQSLRWHSHFTYSCCSASGETIPQLLFYSNKNWRYLQFVHSCVCPDGLSSFLLVTGCLFLWYFKFVSMPFNGLSSFLLTTRRFKSEPSIPMCQCPLTGYLVCMCQCPLAGYLHFYR